jgi:S1-C subfamily serine protease
MRDGDEKEIEVELGDRNKYLGVESKTVEKDESYGWLGLKVKDLTETQKDQLKLEDGGIIITDIEEDSRGENGLRVGDIIYKVWHGGKAISIDSVEDFEKMGEDVGDSNKSILINFLRDGRNEFVVIK